MDPIRNPFSPGAGAPPPELVGRDAVLEQVRILLGRTRQRRSEKSVILIGLRGVGKTVLLNEMKRTAQRDEYITVSLEAHEQKALAVLLIPELRRVLLELDRMAGFSEKVRRGLGVFRSFINSVKIKVSDIEIGLDIEPAQGSADTGDLEIDLPALFVAVGEAAQDRKTAIAIFIDEIQYLSSTELSALIMAMHQMQQQQLPIVLVGAGLPILPALAGDSKSYAERLFDFPEIGPLSADDVRKALQEPVSDAGVTFESNAVTEIAHITQGYPYFLQEWGYQAWNCAAKTPITLDDVNQATTKAIQRLDANFFRVRFDRLAPSEKRFLSVMATLGPGAHRIGEIAAQLGVKTTSLGPIRAKLINKGMIYSPVHGDIAFTVPLFDEFMRRAMPELQSM